jgi:hypothetical protein
MAVQLGANYVLEESIGRGSFGEVWRGSIRDTGAPVAVKMLRPELAGDPEVVDRFLRERGILVGLAHPNVVSVADLVAEGDKLGIVMQLVAGGDLRSYLSDRGSVEPSQTCLLMAQVCQGLAAAHAAGVIHRDLKPENVLIDGLGEGQDERALVARITDFGIARIIDQVSMSRPSAFLGTPSYLAPEVAQGRAASPAADVYAVGIMTYELLCGRPPFHADHPWALLMLHVNGEALRPPAIPDTLWEVVAACLAKDPLARPHSGTVAASLAALALEFGGAGPPDATGRRLDAPTVPPGRSAGPLPRPSTPGPVEPLAGPADAPRRVTHHRRRWVLLVTTLVVLAAFIAVLAGKFLERPDRSVLVAESFRRASIQNPNWVLDGSSGLTGNSNTGLRLTSDSFGQVGMARLDQPLDSSRGITIEFDYATYGGQVWYGRTGDGMAVFLTDGARSISRVSGAGGGALGYACGSSPEIPAQQDACPGGNPGVADGIVGIGLDEYGNFSNPTEGGDGPSAPRPDHVVIRGSGTGTAGFRYLAGAPVPGGVRSTAQSKFRRVRVTIADQRLTVAIKLGRTFQTLIDKFDLAGAPGQAPVPATVKIGFAAATGDATNFHEIRDLTIRKGGAAPKGPRPT